MVFDEQQTKEAPVNKALVFLAGGGGPILFYAVFWGRHTEVISGQVEAMGMAMLAVSGLGVLVLAGLAGLLALLACHRIFDGFTLGVTAVASIFVLDLGAGGLGQAPVPATGGELAVASAPRDHAGLGPLSVAQSRSIVQYLGLVLSPVSTVSAHYETRAAQTQTAPRDTSREEELTTQLAEAREELEKQTERLTAESADAFARAQQAERERDDLQQRLDGTAGVDEQVAEQMAEAQAMTDELTLQLIAATTTRENLENELAAAKAAAADAETVRGELAQTREELETTRGNNTATITSLRSRLTELESRVETLSGPVEVAVSAIITMGSRVSGVQGSQPGEVKLVRMEAERALRRVGEPGIDALIIALADDNSQIREFAVDQLGRQGGAADRAIKELNIVATRDPDPAVQAAAQRAISRIVGNE